MASATLDLPWPIDLALTVASHGWVHLEPWRWEPETGTLSHAERIAGERGTISLAQRDPTTLAIAWEGFSGVNPTEILRRTARWVSAEWDPASAITALAAGFVEEAALIARGGGRILCCSTFYEDFIKTVLTVNTSWSGNLLDDSSRSVAEPGEGQAWSRLEILDYGEERLRCLAKLGFRAPVVMAATQRLLDDGVMDEAGNGYPERLDHDYLREPQRHRPLRGGALPDAAARFQPHPGRSGRRRPPARAARYHPG